jgi:CRISPR system Cascade subunit CasD
MVQHLIFTVLAPLGSWGSPGSTAANAALKLTELAPTRSALIGLLAACMGLERHRQSMLARALLLAVRTDVAPSREPLPDFHTVTRGKRPDREGSWTRFEEVRLTEGLRSHEGCILSRRESFNGGLWTVAVALMKPDIASDLGEDFASATLDTVASALKCPVYVPYIGRRCYPLGLPLDPEVIEASGPVEAMAIYGNVWTRRPFSEKWLIPIRQENTGHCQLAWDSGYPGAPLHALRTIERRDDPAHISHESGLLSRAFHNRTERQTLIESHNGNEPNRSQGNE